MTSPGAATPYWTLENRDGLYYIGYQQQWVSQPHFAAMLSQELAEMLQKRYPGSTIEREIAYGVTLRLTIASVNEPEAKLLLAKAIKLCRLENWSLETTQVQVEQIYAAS